MKLMSWRRSRPDGTDATPSSPMKKILVLTAGYGEGHNSAARALQSAFNENPAVEAELIDLFALRAPRLNNFYRRAYVKVINTAPKIWSAIYGWLDRSPLVPLTFKALGSHRELLGRLIAEKSPAPFAPPTRSMLGCSTISGTAATNSARITRLSLTR